MTLRNRSQQGNNNSLVIFGGIAGVVLLLIVGLAIAFKGEGGSGIVEPLSTTLTAGNTSGGNSIIMNENGDVISFIRTNDIDIDALVQSLAVAHAQLPDLLGTTDQFVFEDLSQTLINKVLTSPIINTPNIVTATISGTTTFSDQNITNVGDIILDSITADGSTIIINNDIDMSNSDLNNIGDASTDITSTLARFGVPIEIELNVGGVYQTTTQGGIDDGKVSVLAEEWSLTDATFQSLFQIVIGNSSCGGTIDFTWYVVNVNAGESNGGTLQMVFARRSNNSTKNNIFNQVSSTVIHVGSFMTPTFATTLSGGATSDPQDLNFWVYVDNGNNTNMNIMFKAELTSTDADGSACDIVMESF